MGILGLPWLQLFPVLNLKPTLTAVGNCNVSREFPSVSVCSLTLSPLPIMTDEA